MCSKYMLANGAKIGEPIDKPSLNYWSYEYSILTEIVNHKKRISKTYYLL